MIPKGYYIIVKDYIAEIVEFRTIEIINTPDDTHIYHIDTKYGEDFVEESRLKPIRKMLEEECKQLNEAMGKSRGAGVERSGHKIY